MRTVFVTGSREWDFGIHGKYVMLRLIVEHVFARHIPVSEHCKLITGEALGVDAALVRYAAQRGYEIEILGANDRVSNYAAIVSADLSNVTIQQIYTSKESGDPWTVRDNALLARLNKGDLFIGIWNGQSERTPRLHDSAVKMGIPARLLKPTISVTLTQPKTSNERRF